MSSLIDFFLYGGIHKLLSNVQAITKDYDSKYIDGRVDILGRRYQLDLDLNRLEFSHHHLFSREHVLASRLKSLFAEYTSRNRNDIVLYYTERVSGTMRVSWKIFVQFEFKIQLQCIIRFKPVVLIES